MTSKTETFRKGDMVTITAALGRSWAVGRTGQVIGFWDGGGVVVTLAYRPDDGISFYPDRYDGLELAPDVAPLLDAGEAARVWRAVRRRATAPIPDPA